MKGKTFTCEIQWSIAPFQLELAPEAERQVTF
jgi:hypothetical protein